MKTQKDKKHHGRKEPPISRSRLGYSFIEQINIGINPKIGNSLQHATAHPLAKMLGYLFYMKRFKGRVHRLREIIIPTVDGAGLATDIYLPEWVAKKHEKAPTILIRTPYWKDSISLIGHIFALNGYVCVIQDVRGCAHSGPYGNNTFFFGERVDGLTSLRWISKQFWYNGKIGMWGASYFGLTQWAVSWDNNGAVTCLNPAISSPRMMWSAHNGLDPWAIAVDIARIFHETTKFYDGATPKRFMREWTHQYTEHLLRNPKYALYNDPPDGSNYILDLDRDLKGLTFEEKAAKMKELFDIEFNKRDFGKFLRLVYRLILHREGNFFSEYMAGMLEFDPKKINTPILILSGWYDMFSRPIMDTFAEIMSNGSEYAKTHTRIIIGPWAHGDVQRPGSLWEVLFSPGGWYDMLRTLIPWEWYACLLKDEDNGADRKPPVRLYVMGKNEWRYERTWPLERAQIMELYLHSNGSANSSSGDGRLTYFYPGESEPYDGYVFDPMNPVITCGGNNLGLPKGARDQRIPESRKDVLVYTSPPLKEGMEVTGNVEVILYASSDCEDTDFMVKLCDVYPSGKSVNILDRGIRARYRKLDYRHPEPLVPGEIYKFRIPLGPTSIYFKRGHRIRVDITSSDFPKYNINANLYGKGKPGDYKTAHQKVYHDAEHPSRILLPVIPPKYF